MVLIYNDLYIYRDRNTGCECKYTMGIPANLETRTGIGELAVHKEQQTALQ